jgi:hypothetical protein
VRRAQDCRRLCLALALAACSHALAAPPRKVEIAYELLRNGMPLGTVTSRLEWSGGRYSVSEQVRGRGAFARSGEAVRSSKGNVTREGLRPLEFEDRRTGRDTARARFDWSAKTLTLQYQGEPRTQALPAAAHDQLSYLYGFAFKQPGSQPFTVNVSDGRGVSTHVYRAAGRERLKTAAGDFDTLRIVRQKDAPGDRGAEIWLAVDRHFLPLRILLTEKQGVRLEQTAVRVVLQ